MGPNVGRGREIGDENSFKSYVPTGILQIHQSKTNLRRTTFLLTHSRIINLSWLTRFSISILKHQAVLIKLYHVGKHQQPFLHEKYKLRKTLLHFCRDKFEIGYLI